MNMILEILILALGFFLLVKGADWFVEGAAGIADLLKIPQLVIGLTIVAMGTSMPEAAVSITAALKGNAGITIGNVVGSNILNILIILGLSALVASMAIQKSTLKIEMPYMIFVTALLMFMGGDGVVTRVEGAVLWAFFIIYLIYLFHMAKNGEAEEAKKTEKPLKLIILTILGGAIVVLGSDLTVDSATAIAEAIGLSQRFIGLTIVALGTSLPELVTSVTAAKKGNADIAIGNIVGSNIFNILFVVGTAALITPVTYEAGFLIDAVIAMLAGVLLIVSVIKTKSLRRPWGFVFLGAYCLYFIYLLR